MTSNWLLQTSAALIAEDWWSGAELDWQKVKALFYSYLLAGIAGVTALLAGAAPGGAVWAASELAHQGPALPMQRHQGRLRSSRLTFAELRMLDFPWLSWSWRCLSSPFTSIKLHLYEIDAVLISTLWINLYVSFSLHKSVVICR